MLGSRSFFAVDPKAFVLHLEGFVLRVFARTSWILDPHLHHHEKMTK